MKKVPALYLYLALLLLIITGSVVPSFAKYQYGNIILEKYEKEIKKEKLDPVVYPHWIHTMWFKCKVCHEEIFIKETGANDITMKDINNGEKCGKCHNGSIAFPPKECKRCHSLSSDEAAMTLKTDARTARLYPSIFTRKLTKGKEKKNKYLKFENPANVPFSEFKTIADRLNVQWDAKYIEENGLPFDKFKMINWAKIYFEKIIIPKNSIKDEKEEKIRDNMILFEVLSDFVNNVVFPHKNHSYLINCNTCHEEIFTSTLGSNEIHMRELSDGKFCGRCHGKTSFPLAACKRCHKYSKEEKINFKGTLLKRKNPLKNKNLDISRGKGLSVGGDKSTPDLIQETKQERQQIAIETEKQKEEKREITITKIIKQETKQEKQQITIETEKQKEEKREIAITKTIKQKTGSKKAGSVISIPEKLAPNTKSKLIEKNEEIKAPKRGVCIFF